MTEPQTVPRRPPRAGLDLGRALLACGAIGPPLFVVTFLIAGATRPDYSPVRHPVSSLGLGDTGWVQATNFVVTGLLLVAFAVGLRPALRRYRAGIAIPLLVGVVGIGLVGAGVFTTDPVSGYPPGTPMHLQYTTEGALHDAFSAPVFLGLPIACAVAGYRFARAHRPWWATYSVATGVVFLVGFFLASAGFSQEPALAPIGGLLQRLTVITGWTWLTALAIHLLRAPHSPGQT